MLNSPLELRKRSEVFYKVFPLRENTFAGCLITLRIESVFLLNCESKSFVQKLFLPPRTEILFALDFLLLICTLMNNVGYLVAQTLIISKGIVKTAEFCYVNRSRVPPPHNFNKSYCHNFLTPKLCHFKL